MIIIDKTEVTVTRQSNMLQMVSWGSELLATETEIWKPLRRNDQSPCLLHFPVKSGIN